VKFIFVTLFPELISGYFINSILKNAIDNKLIDIEFINPRDYSTDKYKKVDDYLIGGGAGLLIRADVMYSCLKELKERYKKAHFVFPTPVGKPFIDSDASRLSNLETLIFVCGRYEGIDERVIEIFGDEVFSIGDFILTGGELASLVMVDSISRYVDGVLGNSNSLNMESFSNEILEAPSFTKPELFMEIKAPSELSKGNHSKISALQNELALLKTKYFRPDLYIKYQIRKKNAK